MCDFRVGDRVIIYKPGRNGVRRGLWISSCMDKFDGAEGVIETCVDDCLCKIAGYNYHFHLSWLEKVETKEEFNSDVTLEDFL